MPTVISCPSCQKQLKVPDELIGRQVKCPGCKETFTAQAGAPPAAVQEEPEPPPRRRPAPPPEEEEEAPRRPARRAAQDEEEEHPSRRRRSGGAALQPHRGVMILVLGILSIVCCGFLGIAAWMMGNTDIRAMDEGTMDPQGRQMTQIGKILGIVGIVLMVVLIFCNIIGFVLQLATGGGGH
jgi:predicted Zn finger-like uncharacterized protein